MQESKHQEDSDWLKYLEISSGKYDEFTYENSVIGFVNRSGHHALERDFGPKDHFSNVIEIGAGTGEHLAHVRHGYDRYVMTDLSEKVLEIAKAKHGKNERVVFKAQDALNLDFDDDTFDRLISIYNLEHLPDPHLAIKEWKRVVRPGGFISIALPIEGGMAWNLGRYLTTRRYFRKQGMDLDLIIAREHINAFYKLKYLINYYFRERSESRFPFPLSVNHINLVYTSNCRNSKR